LGQTLRLSDAPDVPSHQLAHVHALRGADNDRSIYQL
jgi:hypothetical protein